jgi:nitrate/nitrite transport system ATP-binding protein
MKKYLEIWHLAKSFPTPTGSALIVRDFDLTIAEGEFVTLIGHSGCGKSTVLSIVAGLTGSSDGDVVLAGKEVTGPGTDRGVVFQAPCLFDVGLARAFALSPKMLLLDEPFGMLDSLTRLELQGVLMELWTRKRITALMVTHDVDEALYLSDRVAMMTSGPGATLGGVLDVPFERPRDRVSLMELAEYDGLRDQVIGFLESQQHGPPPEEAPPDSESATKAHPDLVLAELRD